MFHAFIRTGVFALGHLLLKESIPYSLCSVWAQVGTVRLILKAGPILCAWQVKLYILK